MIIDSHTHLFPPEIQKNRAVFFEKEPAFKLLYESEKSRMVGAGEMVQMMDREGVDRSVVFGFPWQNPETIMLHNDYIIDAVRQYPQRLIGLCCFDMSYPKALEETIRCVNAGLSGVGELASYTSAMNDSILINLDPVMAFCQQQQLPVLIHTNEPVGHAYPGKAPESVSGAYRFIQRFPQNKIVLAHWGGGLFFYSLLKKEVKNSLKNVYFDTAASPFLYDVKVYQTARDLVGIEKLLFGSDFPLIKPSRYFEELEQSGLSKEEIDLIKGENAASLFNKTVDIITK